MKKNLAKLLAVSVSMGMLTACGGNGGKTETTAAETKAVLRLHLPLSDHVLTGLFFYRGIRDLG